MILWVITQLGLPVEMIQLTKPEQPIILLNLPIILSRISQNYYLLFSKYPIFLKILDLKSCYSVLALNILASVRV